MNFSSIGLDMLSSLQSALAISNLSRSMNQDKQSVAAILDMAESVPAPPKTAGEIGASVDIKI